MRTSCLSGVYRLEIIYILCDFPRVYHGSLPSCTLLGRIKRTRNNRSTLGSQGRPHRPETRGCEAPSFPDGTTPGFFALCGPVWPISTPGGGTDPSPPVPGRFGPHRAQFGRTKRNRLLSRLGENLGVILKQDKGSGSLERPQPDHFARQSRS